MKIRNALLLLTLALIPTLLDSRAVPMARLLALPLPTPAGADDAIRYVGAGSTAGRNGEDIGAQINAAYASLPATGGTIVVISEGNGRCYSFNTPILANVPGKYLMLEGGLLGGQIVRAAPMACLDYTAMIGTAISLDYAPIGGVSSGAAVQHGLRDLTLANGRCETVGGCGSYAVGVAFGAANAGAQGATFTGLRVIGFGTGLSVMKNESQGRLAFRDCVISHNTTGFLNEADSGHVSFEACHFEGNGTGASSTAALRISNSWMESNSILGVSCASPAVCDLNDDHFENSDTDTTHFLAGNGVFSVLGGDMRDDHTTGNTDWWMNFAGASFFVLGTVLTTGGRTATHVILNETQGFAVVQNTSPSILVRLYAKPSARASLASDANDASPQDLLQNVDQFMRVSSSGVSNEAGMLVPSVNAKTALDAHSESDAAVGNGRRLSGITMVDGLNYSSEKAALMAAGENGVVFDTPIVRTTALLAPTESNAVLYNFSSIIFRDWNNIPRFTNYLYRDNSVGSPSALTNSSIFLQPQTTVTVADGAGQEMDSILIFPKWNLSSFGTAPPTLSGLAVGMPVVGTGSVKARDSATLRIESNPPTSTCVNDANSIPQCWALSVDAGRTKFGSNVYFNRNNTGLNMSTGSEGSTFYIFNLDGGASTLALGQAGVSRLVLTGNALSPSTAGAMTLGLANSPYSAIFIGTAATNNALVRGRFGQATTIDVPDPGQATATLAYRNIAQNWIGNQIDMALTTPTLSNPVINGGITGTGIQGTDPRLLTSGAVSGSGSLLCLDANGGATTRGCGASVVRAMRSGPSCTTQSDSYSTCTTILTWPTPFADANYAVTCTGIGPSDPRANVTIAGRSASTVVVNVVTYGSVAVSFSELDCTGAYSADSVSSSPSGAPSSPSGVERTQPPVSHPIERNYSRFLSLSRRLELM